MISDLSILKLFIFKGSVSKNIYLIKNNWFFKINFTVVGSTQLSKVFEGPSKSLLWQDRIIHEKDTCKIGIIF